MITRSALPIALFLVVAACGGSSDESSTTTVPDATAAPDDPAGGVSPPDAAPPTSGETTASAPGSTTPAAATPVEPDPICPEPAIAQSLEPVDPTGQPIPAEGAGLEAGRYATEKLGVSIAFDVTGGLNDAGIFGSTIAMFDPTGENSVSIHRASDFVTELPTFEETERGIEPTAGDFDTWLANAGVEVIAETSLDVNGTDARDVTVLVPLSSADLTGNRSFTRMWGLIPDDDVPKRIVHVQLEIGPPLVIVVDALQPESAGARAANDVISSLEIGQVGLAPPDHYADTRWDIGNIFDPVLVGACSIPSLAMGGIEFDLVRPALLQGQGNLLWLLDNRRQHEGLIAEPEVRIMQTRDGLEGGDFGPPSIGAEIKTVADAVAQLETKGFTMTPTGEQTTLLGSTGEVFEFVGPSSDPFVFQPGNHVASDGNGFFSLNPGTAGLIHIAELDEGVIMVSVEGEQGTDDIELLRDQFDSVVATLRYQS